GGGAVNGEAHPISRSALAIDTIQSVYLGEGCMISNYWPCGWGVLAFGRLAEQYSIFVLRFVASRATNRRTKMFLSQETCYSLGRPPRAAASISRWMRPTMSAGLGCSPSSSSALS